VEERLAELLAFGIGGAIQPGYKMRHVESVGRVGGPREGPDDGRGCEGAPGGEMEKVEAP
jgi:hypothetical protein